MSHHIELEFATRTDTGLVRTHNEDAIAISRKYGFAVLADGMGGYNAGEVASSMAVSVFKEGLEDGLVPLPNQSHTFSFHLPEEIKELLVNVIQRANLAIRTAAINSPKYQGMGTTLVSLLFHQDKIVVAHVGDSRAYCFRHGKILQITRDHSLIQEQIDSGLITPELAAFAPNKNLVTRAVGIDPTAEVEIHDYPAQLGDLYLLCSDGLSDMLTFEDISNILTRYSSALQTACDALIQKANAKGGRDNISAILIKVQADNAGIEGMPSGILRWNS